MSKLLFLGLLSLLTLSVIIHHGSGKKHKCGFFYHSWYRNMSFCRYPSQLFLGLFNEDKFTDMLCHDKQGGKTIAYATKTGIFKYEQWHRAMNWCFHSTAKLLVGDFNGDRQDDLLCHDFKSGVFWIAFVNSKGQFHGTDWHQKTNWCIGENKTLLVGDFNGNKRADLLCHDRTNGSKSIGYSDCDGEFKGPSWSGTHGWCTDPRAEIYVGDFNGDGRSDLLCSGHSEGKSIAFANFKGEFSGAGWEDKKMKWCLQDKTANRTGQLVIGDFNGDGRADWLCHDIQSGYKQIAFASRQGHFVNTTWTRDMKWCIGSKVRVGSFNGDKLDDLLCLNRRGSVWITYGECYYS